MDNFSELITKRQSERKYISDKEVPLEFIEKCIEAARIAPSATNSQPWHFVVVTDKELVKKVGDASIGLGMNKFVPTVPVVIAVVLEKSNFMSRIGSVLKGKEYQLIDIGFAVSQLTLQATDLGLGSCVIGWFDEKKLKKLLEVPSSKRIPLIITLGYSCDPHRAKKRKSTKEICSFNLFKK